MSTWIFRDVDEVKAVVVPKEEKRRRKKNHPLHYHRLIRYGSLRWLRARAE
jgi:hypothetical protein